MTLLCSKTLETGFMSIASSLTIAQPNPDGSLPIPAPAAPSANEAAAAQLQQRAEEIGRAHV